MLTGKNNEEKIWNYLKGAGLNEFGAAGLVGNLYAESGLIPTNLQNAYEKRLGMTDAAYTAAVDSGAYCAFDTDAAGYGLAQWTFHTRKAALRSYAKSSGRSIGDLEMQLDFLMKELGQSYKGVLNTLKTAGSVREASDAVLLNYERPADQGAAAQAKRAAFGQKYYEKYAAAAAAHTQNGGKAMSNSALVNYTKISPNRTSPRKNKIKKITIHHMAGNLSVETCGGVFAPTSRRASSNYGIGSDGRVGMYVEEKDRSWCSSSADNDNQAVTIEVANDETGGQWHVSDKAMEKLIELCVDICKRNGIEKLNYTGNKTGNLTMHKWFAPTVCPGPYLESKFPYIAEQVNKKLGASTAGTTSAATGTEQAGRDTELKLGDLVTMDKAATVYGTTKKFSAWVYGMKLYVRGIGGDRIVVSTLKSGAVTGAVDKKYLTKV